MNDPVEMAKHAYRARKNGEAGHEEADYTDLPAGGTQTAQTEACASEEIPWPESMAEEAYHGLVGQIVRAIEPHTEADPVALLVQLLIGVGNRIGRTAHFRVEGDTHYLNEFAVLVGRTSKGRKGTSWGRSQQYLEKLEPVWMTERKQGGLASGEGMVYAIRDPVVKSEPVKERGRITGYQEVQVDDGVNDKRLLLIEEEYGGVLRMLERQGNSLSQRLREAWQGRPLGSMTKNSPTRCREPHISMLGHCTAEEVRRYLSHSEMANGLGNRHLWFCVQRSKCLPDGGSHVPDESLVAEFRDAANFALGVGELRRNEPARQLWHAVYPDLSEGKAGMAGAMIGRAEAHVMRLACLYAVLDQSQVIAPTHLTAALALWDYCEASVRYIFGDSLGDPVADEILRSLKSSPKGMTRDQIRELFGRHRSSAEIGRALALLSQLGLARMTKEPSTGASRGRDIERWLAVSGPARKARKAP